MAKIKTPILFSYHFNINPTVLSEMGIFDPILNTDTKLFIDPTLLERSSHEMIRNQAAEIFKTFCGNIISLLEESSVKGDFAYKKAEKLITGREIEGTCLGYGTGSISGRSISSVNREKIISTAKEIIKIGVKKPELFILLPLFEEGIGPDTISDITTFAIHSVLLEFTLQIAQKLNIKTVKFDFNGEEIDIIQNPLQRKISPIILIPQDILRKLPFMSTWDDITGITIFNQNLRTKINRYISQIFTEKTKKAQMRKLAMLMKNRDGINTLIEIIKEGKIKPYDFQLDEDSFMMIKNFFDIAGKYPKKINLKSYNKDDIEMVVKTIIDQFKFLIEEKGINSILWDKDGNPVKEEFSQKLFLVIAYAYCKANDIDINPEMDTGIGYVDFKFSQGFSKRIIVEIKHSYNSNIINGFTTQLALYEKSEETHKGFYVVINVGGIGKKLEKLTELYQNDQNKRAQIICVDGFIKVSASKRKEKNTKVSKRRKK